MLTLSPIARETHGGAVQTLERPAENLPGIGGRCTPAAAVQSSRLVVAAPNEAELMVADQKKLFVSEVVALALAKHIPRREACALVAARVEMFPDLVRGGHGGRSLIGETTAWPNFRQWQAKLERGDDLCPRYRGSRGYSRPGDDRFWTLLANLYENPNQLSLRYAYDLAVKASAGSDMAGDDGAVPTYDQVHHYYKVHADQKAVLVARMGEEWFRNNVAGYIRREAPRVDECWFSDHHIFDAAVRVWDKAAERWVAVRPWLTAWLDWGSLYFVGFQVRTIYPNRDSIERALRIGIEKNGGRPPLHLYIDNGRDYTAALGAGAKRLLDGDDERRLNSLGALCGCRIHFAIPFNARAKVIERIFGIVCVQFSKLWQSYRGSSPEHRPEAADAAWAHPETLPTIEQFSAAFEEWLASIYHAQKSGGEILAGRSPYEARRGGVALREPMDPAALYKAFLREVPGLRTIQRGGVVRALNRWYQSDQLWRLLGGREPVSVRVDPDNLAAVWIYTADGREIGPAAEVQRLPALIAGTDDADKPRTIEDLREAMKAQRRQVNGAKAASAANRGLGRWLNRPSDSAGLVFTLPAAQPASSSSPAAAGVVPAATSCTPPHMPADPVLVAELEAVLRDEVLSSQGADDDFLRDIGAG